MEHLCVYCNKFDERFNFLHFRIRTETNGGAWCPKPQVAEGITEWLEIDLGELKVITAVETQGRFGNGQVIIRYNI